MREVPDKLLTLGLVGLGLAHELNAPLTATRLGLELLALRLRGPRAPAPDEAADEIDRLLSRLLRATELIDRFRRFARGRGGKPRAVALDEVVDSVCALVRPALGELNGVLLVRGARSPAAQVVVDALLLEQAAAIAVLNAGDALAERSGTVTLSVGADEARAWILVADDGPGFTEPDSAGVAGYSTKGAAGMGVGLALARQILAQAGGALETS
ncbi:MAG: HAMP domain-containing histidine kinase, partial [Myxococcales bacterium]|nr:HAMP domain-containing histidine kinase [Myxococcales bacterium]